MVVHQDSPNPPEQTIGGVVAGASGSHGIQSSVQNLEQKSNIPFGRIIKIGHNPTTEELELDRLRAAQKTTFKATVG